MAETAPSAQSEQAAPVCLNCGADLLGRHCHHCGQAAHVHRTLRGFFHDLFHGVFHFEGKFLRTLPLLAWHPGRLTRAYIDGRRASYGSPIAVFLFAVFLSFAVFNLTSGGPEQGNALNVVVNGGERAEQDTKAWIAKLEQDLADARKEGEPTDDIEGQLDGARGALDGIRAANQGEGPQAKVQSNIPGFANRITAAWNQIRANPDLAIYKLQTSAYKYSWLLIPLSVPFVWLLFPFNRRFRLFDHTVFVTYSLSFMLLLLGAASLTGLGDGVIAGALTFVLLGYAPVHLYRQLRHGYALTRGGALWRMALLLLFAAVVLALFAGAVLALALG